MGLGWLICLFLVWAGGCCGPFGCLVGWQLLEIMSSMEVPTFSAVGGRSGPLKLLKSFSAASLVCSVPGTRGVDVWGDDGSSRVPIQPFMGWVGLRESFPFSQDEFKDKMMVLVLVR